MINNYSKFGFNIQRLICEKYHIVPCSSKAINIFKSTYDLLLTSGLSPLVDYIFSTIGQIPVQCTTLYEVDKKKFPYNFILSDNSTLSIRTNIKGDKVAPREVGQAGFTKLNEHFKVFLGREIKNKDDIKELIFYKISKILPIFLNYFFDADYIAWVFKTKDKFDCELISGSCFIDIDFNETKFSFSRKFEDWNESITLKYDGLSIAEIQVHKNRTFKFRFIVKNILLFAKNQLKNTETLGITAEKTLCDIYHLEYPESFRKRSSLELEKKIKPILENAFQKIPQPIKHCGSLSGERGGQSKSSYDFILKGNKKLSLKTNTGKMVCPPEVGQPNSETCYSYFKDFVKEDHIDKVIFKEMIFERINEIFPIYISHLFDSDYLLRIYEKGKKYEYQIVEKNYGISIEWKKENFSFSKKNIIEWKESNTVYYDNLTVGEFQVHNNRNCFKFRFNFDNLIKLINDYLEDLKNRKKFD